jgi:hypothetical protein
LDKLHFERKTKGNVYRQTGEGRYRKGILYQLTALGIK